MNKKYDFSIPLKADEFEQIKNKQKDSVCKNYDEWLSQKVNNACFDKYCSSLEFLYSDSRKIRGCIKDAQTFLVRFYNKKQSLVCECVLDLHSFSPNINSKKQLIIQIKKEL